MSGRTVVLAPETFNLAETTRMIEVARALAGRYRCVVAGYSERYAGIVREAGLEYRPLAPVLSDAQADQLLRADQLRGVRHPFDVPTVRARVAAETTLLREVDAAAVVIGMTLTQLVSARAVGVPLVHVKPYAYCAPHLERIDRFPLTSGRTRLARVVDAVAARAVRAAAPRVTARPRSFDVVARERGVALPRATVQALEADVNLLTSITGVVGEVPLPRGYAHVGPVFARLGGDLPAEVRDRLVASTRPVVYLGLGSSAPVGLVERALRALAGMPLTVVAPVAHYLDAATVARLAGELGPHVVLTGLLPTDALLPLVDAAVLHGGEGTVQAALVHGVPFVGMGLQMEQRWNVEECVRLGAALAARPGSTGSRRFAQSVAAVVRDPSYRVAARGVQERLRGVDGAARAAHHIDQLITTGRPPGGEGKCTH